MRAVRESVAERVFASNEPIEAMHHLFKGVQHTVDEYNEQYATIPEQTLHCSWGSDTEFRIIQGSGKEISIRLSSDRRSLQQTQYPTHHTKTIPLAAHLDGHVFFDDVGGESKTVFKVAGEVIMDLLFPEG